MAAICEDDEFLRQDAKDRVQEVRKDYIVDTYATGDELLASKGRYDIVFLDIEMPGKDGMTIAKELRRRRFKGHIIFLTSHTEFMPEAFKVKAFRFLDKPLKMEALEETIVEAEKEIFLKKKQIVTDCGTEVLVNISDILYIESKRNKTVICTKYEKLETNYTLKYWIREMGPNEFFQTHKSYMISLRHIKEFDADSVSLHGTEDKVPVSRRNVGAVKNAFFDYVRANAKYV